MNIRPHIEKLQGLSDIKKKIILWTVVAVLAIVMGFFWVKGTIRTFSQISQSVKNVNMPSLDILETTTPTNK